MRIRVLCVAAAAAALLGSSVVITAFQQAPSTPPQGGNGWVLGEDAATKKNPLTADEATLAKGKGVFKEKCQKCHGPGGLGDGPDGDPDARGDMDLTNPKRAARNNDGDTASPDDCRCPNLSLLKVGSCVPGTRRSTPTS